MGGAHGYAPIFDKINCVTLNSRPARRPEAPTILPITVPAVVSLLLYILAFISFHTLQISSKESLSCPLATGRASRFRFRLVEKA